MKNVILLSGHRALLFLLLTTTLSGQILTSCKSVRNTNRTQRGAAIGTGSGAVIGGVIGRRYGGTAAGAIIGAVVGGAAGAVIGRQMDRQAEELKRQLPNAQVERVGEGIKITFNSDILFAVGSDQLTADTERNLADFAQTLNKYPDTDLLIEGHADASGSTDLNQRLSERRAASVVSYLKTQGVKGGRLDEKGYGESQPVADNSSEAGRRKNRRVEIAVFANDSMKKKAQNGEIGQ
jgi:outer membrane protein OmpA-like peptidoglycan-associated protein